MAHDANLITTKMFCFTISLIKLVFYCFFKAAGVLAQIERSTKKRQGVEVIELNSAPQLSSPSISCSSFECFVEEQMVDFSGFLIMSCAAVESRRGG